jgi:DNA-binding transcriptional MerR regulator
MAGTAGGYTIVELAREAGVSTRTIRSWYTQGLFVAPPFAGPSTRYDAEHRLRVLAIQKMRREGLRMAAIKQRLTKMSLADIEAFLAPPPPAPRPPPPEPTYTAEHWERIVLVPGLEVHVNGAGGPILRRMAQEIVSYFGGAGA